MIVALPTMLIRNPSLVRAGGTLLEWLALICLGLSWLGTAVLGCEAASLEIEHGFEGIRVVFAEVALLIGAAGMWTAYGVHRLAYAIQLTGGIQGSCSHLTRCYGFSLLAIGLLSILPAIVSAPTLLLFGYAFGSFAFFIIAVSVVAMWVFTVATITGSRTILRRSRARSAFQEGR